MTHIQNIQFFYKILLLLLGFYQITGFTAWLTVQSSNYIFRFFNILNNFLYTRVVVYIIISMHAASIFIHFSCK